MEGLARFAVRQSLLVNLVGVTMVVVGAFTLQEMHRESLPQVPTGWCRVEVAYPGASAEEIEQLVLEPMENAVWNVDGIAEMWGSARDPELDSDGVEAREQEQLDDMYEAEHVRQWMGDDDAIFDQYAQMCLDEWVAQE